MTALRDLDLPNLAGSKGDIYDWRDGAAEGTLDVDDDFTSVGDLGYEDDWAPATRVYLMSHRMLM
ncbi:MAG: hypothetical protein HC831_15620 [Chloroflexia bacterium]|nr:hypothetical protein [Chloroflexia bacterium]